ncbi:MAG TPA: hypothetical protein VEL47_05285 [Myxococcota bacterium]|nr:hypothetical protein [Myxococcota bacterium]
MKKFLAIIVGMSFSAMNIAGLAEKNSAAPSYFICESQDENQLFFLSYIGMYNVLIFADDVSLDFALVTAKLIGGLVHTQGTYDAIDGATRVSLMVAAPVDQSRQFEGIVKFKRMSGMSRDPIRTINLICDVLEYDLFD